MDWLTSLGLCLAGLVAIIIELFVPAAGIIGVLGLGSMVGGVVFAFVHYGPVVGASFLIGIIIVTPIVVIIYFKIFPRSFVGRWLILKHEQKREEGFASYRLEGYEKLTGAAGEALTTLRPAGMARFEGKKYSVVTGGEFIDRGEPITVVSTEGSRIVVRKA